MVEIWEENPADQNVSNIINCLSDKSGDKVVFLVLSDTSERSLCFQKAQKVFTNKHYDSKIILLWLKSISKLPDVLKNSLTSIKDIIAVVLNEQRDVTSVLRSTELIDAAKIEASLFD